MKIDIVKLQMLQKIAEHQQHPTKASPPTRARPLRLSKRGCRRRCSRSSSRPPPRRRWSARRCRRRRRRRRMHRESMDCHVARDAAIVPSSSSLPQSTIGYLDLNVCARREREGDQHGCQMAIARFSDRKCLALRASGLWLRYARLQN